MIKKVLVVLPTYNESQTIKEVLAGLFKPSKNYRLSVLVVDDNSPDGTAKLVTKLQAKYVKLHLITGQKNGLGAAYKRGFEYARKNLDFDALVMMDADMSHNPADVKRLVSALRAGNEVAIGSRYAPGGMIPGNWPLRRILNTRVAHFVTRFIGGVETDLNELTGGFKAIRKSALYKIPYRQARVSGFGFQIFLTNEFVNKKFITVEVPISFADRKAGQSKLGFKDITEFFKVAWELNPTSPFKRLLGMFSVSVVSLIGLFAGLSLVEDAYRANILFTVLSLWMFGLLQLNLIKLDKHLPGFKKYIKAYLLAFPAIQLAGTLSSGLISIVLILVVTAAMTVYFNGHYQPLKRWQIK